MASIRQILLLLACLQIVLCEQKHCGVQKFKPRLQRAPQARIRRMSIGSQIPVNHSWPWVGYTGCSGVLVNPNNHPTESDIVLTARHCNPGYVHDVLFGSNNVAEEYKKVEQLSRKRLEVKLVIPHPKLDIAILKLKHPVVFNEFIQPACLPDDTNAIISDPNGCYGVGFGYDVESGKKIWHTGALKQLSLPLSGRPEPWIIHAKNLDGGGMCDGDSGSPYLCLEDDKWVAFAIAAAIYRSDSTACSNSLAVYHSTAYALEWIKENSR